MGGIEISFQPLGADKNSAVYRIVASSGEMYFLKLRRSESGAANVRIPKFLNEQGISQIIAPFETPEGRLWVDLDEYKLILYPFIKGRSGFTVVLSDQQWSDLGSALRLIHNVALPGELVDLVPLETFSGYWRDKVRSFLQKANSEVFTEHSAQKTAGLLLEKQSEIFSLVNRSERLAEKLSLKKHQFVLCHADIHAGNILVDGNGKLHIVDWDTLILAPRERDLMYIGGGQGFPGHTPLEEETLFYAGYGPVTIDQDGLAYYRYERIVEDIAVICQMLLLTEDGGQDREEWFRYLNSNFLPGNTIDIARGADLSGEAG